MSTRSLTHVKDINGAILVTMYKQCDGYPEGMGAELIEFLGPATICNGITGKEDAPTYNGAGCLAAALVARFKTEIGGVYLSPPGSSDCGEEYVYTIAVHGIGENAITLRCLCLRTKSETRLI